MLEREMDNLTNEQLCDIMCSDVEYDDNEYYIHNCNHYKDLWEYEGIKKEEVMVLTYDDEIISVTEVETYDWFDWSDVQEQFAIIKINSLIELKMLMDSWGYSIIIEEPDVYCPIQITQIKIYDSWNE